MFLTSGIFNTVGGYAAQANCVPSTSDSNSQLNVCNNNWINKFTLGDKKNESNYITYQSGLNLLNIILLVLSLHYFRYKQRKRDQDCDDADISANDYTLMINNIPLEYNALNDDYDDDLKEFLEKNALPNKKLNIVKVNLCYNIDELQELQQAKLKIINKKQQYLKEIYKRPNSQITEEDFKKIDNFNRAIENVKSKLYCLEYRFEDGKGKDFMKKYFAGYAFVTVETEQEKEDVIKRFNHSNSFNFLSKKEDSLIYHGNKLVIQQAPYPTDIFWENLKLSNKEKSKRNIQGMIITISLLSVCFLAIFGLQMLQRSLIAEYKSSSSSQNNNVSLKNGQASSEQRFISQLISILISIVITFINQILRNVLNKIAKHEGHPTMTQFNISAARKISLVQFFNSSLIIFIIQIYISFDDRTQFEKIYGVGGLIENQNYVFVFNMVLPSFIEILDIFGKIRAYKRKREEQKGDKCVLIQKQLNDLYEDPMFNIPLRYSSLLNTMFMTSFYSPILPLSILYSIGSLILTYWIDKFNVLYRRTIKNSLGSELSIEMTEMIEYILPIFSSSNLLFFLFITDYEQAAPKIAIAGICIGILNALLPMQYINEKLFYVKLAMPNVQTYKEVEKTFKTSYQNENPATAHHGKKVFLEKFQQRRNGLASGSSEIGLIQSQKPNFSLFKKENYSLSEQSPTIRQESNIFKQFKPQFSSDDKQLEDDFNTKGDAVLEDCVYELETNVYPFMS